MKLIDSHAHSGAHNIPSDYRDDMCAALYEKLGIEKGVFSSIVAILGEMERGNAENFEFVNNNEFAYGYVVVNPLRIKDSIAEMRKYLGKEKIVGLKLHTSYSERSIASPEMRKILDAFHDYHQVILVHSEHCAPTANPLHLAEVADRYPKTKFIIAHHGCALWREACQTAKSAPNIYMDTVSSWNEYDVIKTIVDEIGEDRLMFGSDIGLFDPAPFIGSILSSEISDSVKEKIFYQNAKALFGL